MNRIATLGIAWFLMLTLLVGCIPAESIATTEADSTAGQTTGATEVTDAATETTEATEATLPPETSEPTQPQPTPIIADTFDALLALTAPGALQPEDTVQITGDLEITQPVVFSQPVSFSVTGNVTYTYPIAVETTAPGSIQIYAPKVEAADFVIDAPNCDLIWSSPAPYASEVEAAQLTNVRSCNGVDLQGKYNLGGTGTRKIAAISLVADGELNYQLSGNSAYLAVSYLVGEKALKNARLQITLTDGSSISETLDLTAAEVRYTLTDADGKMRTYEILTNRLNCNLPVFYIDIDNGAEVTSKETYLNATIRIETANAYGDFPSLSTQEVLIRGRGHYSWNFPKTPYKLRFEKKTSVLGMAASKNWVLLANYVDRSLIQNYVAMEMGKVMDNIPYHSNQYPVDVFVNGTYRGVYTFGEQLEAKEERIDLSESYTDPDTDYLLELGGSDPGDKFGQDYSHYGTLRFVAIKHPDSTKLTQEQLDYLEAYMEAADLAVRELSNYEDYIDIDSLIDWVILHELTYNLDCCFRRSCYMIKEQGGKLKMGPIWDFDLAFGSYYRYTTDNWATVGSEGGYVGITWMNYLMKDPAFMAKFTARWNEIKTELLQTALDAVDTMSALVSPSADLNFEVWDILGESVPSQPSSHKKYDTYEKMIGRLREFLTKRYAWMDRQLNT